MREQESFDAFYARTVAGVTGKLHEFAAGDPQADHAVREAYARAYQQWFEVSGFRDTEGWVLDAAKDALARRQAQAGLGASPAQPADSSGTWPGIYRQRTAPADPDATVAPGSPPAGSTAQAGSAAPIGQGHPAAQAGEARGGQQLAGPGPADPYFAGSGQPGRYQPGSADAEAYWADPASPAGLAGGPADRQYPAGRPGRAASTSAMAGLLNRPGSGKILIAVLAVIALIAVGTSAYLAISRGKGTPAAGPTASGGTTGPKPVQMLPAGKIGAGSTVPWTIVGAGWTLAEVSSGQPGPGVGMVTTFLVDPEGGRYTIATGPDSTATTLVAWSGDTKHALFSTASGTTTSYSLLDTRSGTFTPVHLPAGVAVAGFTRPDGTNLLAVQQGPARYKLQRYDLQGNFQRTLAYMARLPSQPAWTDTCAAVCGALSSPDGDTAIWGIAGDEMQLVGNSGGPAHRLTVSQSGPPVSCTPVRWWDSSTVLASCAVTGQPGATRLWLVSVGGGNTTPMTVASGSVSGAGLYTGAWQTGNQTFVTATSTAQCSSAQTGPGGLGILRLASSGSASSLPGSSTAYRNAILGSAAGKLLVLAEATCPGSASLVLLDPASGTEKSLLAAQSGQAGVVAAVAYGSG